MASALDKVITGTVVNIDDPNKTGRVKIRVPGYHDNMEDEQLPWAPIGWSTVFSANGGGQISIPRVGQEVRVLFKKEGDPTSIEWLGPLLIDKELITELKEDYAGSTVLMYDTAANASIKYQPGSGILIYFKGSHIQICPDNTINIHYGEGGSGTQIQLSSGQIDIQAQNSINLKAQTIKLEADNITLDGSAAVCIKGDLPGECGVNGKALVSTLSSMARIIDTKVPQSPGSASMFVNATKEAILNQQVHLI